MNRRGFIAGLGALLAAPAIIRTPGLLMPVKVQPVEEMHMWSMFGNGSVILPQSFIGTVWRVHNDGDVTIKIFGHGDLKPGEWLEA